MALKWFLSNVNCPGTFRRGHRIHTLVCNLRCPENEYCPARLAFELSLPTRIFMRRLGETGGFRMLTDYTKRKPHQPSFAPELFLVE